MKSCAYCDAHAVYRDRLSGGYLCLLHARLEVTGPRGEVPRPPLTIRPSGPADRPRIAELFVRFYGEVEVERLGHRRRVDTLPAYVACDDDEIVGIVSFDCEEETIHIVALYVSPQWQGRGVAHWLIAVVIEMALTEGVKRLAIATTNDDLFRLACYQRMGFAITGIQVGKMVERRGGIEQGLAGIAVRDEIELELQL